MEVGVENFALMAFETLEGMSQALMQLFRMFLHLEYSRRVAMALCCWSSSISSCCLLSGVKTKFLIRLLISSSSRFCLLRIRKDKLDASNFKMLRSTSKLEMLLEPNIGLIKSFSVEIWEKYCLNLVVSSV